MYEQIARNKRKTWILIILFIIIIVAIGYGIGYVLVEIIKVIF